MSMFTPRAPEPWGTYLRQAEEREASDREVMVLQGRYIADLERRLAEQAERAERLAKYARHSDECEEQPMRCLVCGERWHVKGRERSAIVNGTFVWIANPYDHEYAVQPCNCGLDALLAKGKEIE